MCVVFEQHSGCAVSRVGRCVWQDSYQVVVLLCCWRHGTTVEAVQDLIGLVATGAVCQDQVGLCIVQ